MNDHRQHAVASRKITDSKQLGYKSFGIVGDVMVLYDQYLVEQTWLPFMSGCVLYQAPVGDQTKEHSFFNMDFSFQRETTSLIDQINERWHNIHTYVPDEEGVFQRVLPFHEFRHVEGADLSGLYRGDFASFDRGEDGEVYCFEYNRHDHAALQIWAAETCVGRYVIHNGFMYIEREEDAIAARLRTS